MRPAVANLRHGSKTDFTFQGPWELSTNDLVDNSSWLPRIY